jgi:hypothetical protein
MSSSSNAERLLELMREKSPEYLNLITARTDAEFELAFAALLGPAVARLEENKANLANVDEVTLTAFFAAALSVPGLSVSQEKHSNGHVDLTIEANHCIPIRKKLGEAKIYDGYAYHVGGLNQLLTRYTTGRECRGLLLIYFRKANLVGLVRGLREQMDRLLPCNQQGSTSNQVHRWSFLSAHAHPSGELMEVEHVACNLHNEGNDKKSIS